MKPIRIHNVAETERPLSESERKEIEMTRSAPVPPPSPAPEPDWSSVDIHPPPADIARRASCNGRDEAKAFRQVIDNANHQAARLKIFAPKTFELIQLEREAVIEHSKTYYDLIQQASNKVGEIEAGLVARAERLKELSEFAAQLTTSKELLESPESIHVAAADLLLNQQRVKFLPAKIAAAQADVQEITKTILATVEMGSFDLQKIIVALVASTQNERGVVIDQPLRKHFLEGRLHL